MKPAPAGVLATTEATEAAQATVSAGPIGGSGPTTAVAAAVGVASFEDLAIIQRGPDYVVTFEAVPYDLPYRLGVLVSLCALEEVNCACVLVFVLVLKHFSLFPDWRARATV